MQVKDCRWGLLAPVWLASFNDQLFPRKTSVNNILYNLILSKKKHKLLKLFKLLENIRYYFEPDAEVKAQNYENFV